MTSRRQIPKVKLAPSKIVGRLPKTHTNLMFQKTFHDTFSVPATSVDRRTLKLTMTKPSIELINKSLFSGAIDVMAKADSVMSESWQLKRQNDSVLREYQAP